jgi:hypothetical protein
VLTLLGGSTDFPGIILTGKSVLRQRISTLGAVARKDLDSYEKERKMNTHSNSHTHIAKLRKRR